MPRAGALDRRITIQRQVNPDVQASGQVDPDHGWTTMATVWAALRDPSSSDGIRADAAMEVQTRTWTIRYRPDLPVAAGCRVLWRGQVHQVIGVREIGRNDRIDLDTTIIDSPQASGSGLGGIQNPGGSITP